VKFPPLLHAIHEHSPGKVRDSQQLGNRVWFHRFAQRLYHQGNRPDASKRRRGLLCKDCKKGFPFLQAVRAASVTLPNRTADVGPSSRSAVTEVCNMPPLCQGCSSITLTQNYFAAATANAQGSCSLRMFRWTYRQFLRKHYGRRRLIRTYSERSWPAIRKQTLSPAAPNLNVTVGPGSGRHTAEAQKPVCGSRWRSRHKVFFRLRYTRCFKIKNACKVCRQGPAHLRQVAPCLVHISCIRTHFIIAYQPRSTVSGFSPCKHRLTAMSIDLDTSLSSPLPA